MLTFYFWLVGSVSSQNHTETRSFQHPFGVFILTYARSAPRPSFGLFSWGWIITLLILGVFVTDLHFLAGRYVGLTLFFLTPMVGFCLWRMISDHPRLKTPTLVCAGFLMLANVISLHDTKSHYREAGSWLKADATPSDRIYIDSGRTAFMRDYGGIRPPPAADSRRLALKKRSYSLYVLELKSKGQFLIKPSINCPCALSRNSDHPTVTASSLQLPTLQPPLERGFQSASSGILAVIRNCLARMIRPSGRPLMLISATSISPK